MFQQLDVDARRNGGRSTIIPNKIKQSTLVEKLFKHKSPSKSIMVDGQVVIQVSWEFGCVVWSFFSKWLICKCHWVNKKFNMY
jgi:hypothetical protein